MGWGGSGGAGKSASLFSGTLPDASPLTWFDKTDADGIYGVMTVKATGGTLTVRREVTDRFDVSPTAVDSSVLDGSFLTIDLHTAVNDGSLFARPPFKRYKVSLLGSGVTYNCRATLFGVS